MKRRHFLKFLGALPLLGALPGLARAQHTPEDQHGMEPGANKRNVAVLYYDMALMYDYAPAAEIFRVAGHGSLFNLYSVAAGREAMPAMFPRQIFADYTYQDAPLPEVIIIPGGDWPAMRERTDAFDWLKSCQAKGAILYSVCTGGYVLAVGGFLDGIKVAGLQSQLEILEHLAPKAEVQKGLAFVDAGNILTAAGAATSLDASLHLLRRLTDYETARWVAQDYLDHFAWKPDFRGQPG